MKRELVKWQPFQAIIPGNRMVHDVLEQKNKISMPVLSDDQLYQIQERLLYSYQTQEKVQLIYFHGGRLYRKVGKVTEIDANQRRIVLNGHFFLFFSQIVEIF